MSTIVTSLEQLVGNTPLLELTHFEKAHDLNARLLAKLEFYNPSGSIKDRAAWNMIKSAENDGLLHPGDTIVEQTSGNTGIGLAAFAVSRGYKMKIFLERGATEERKLLLEAYGCELLDYRDALGLPKEDGVEPDREATLPEIRAYCASQPTHHYFIDQVYNMHNPEAHILTTGPELWEATEGHLDILVCMAGTGGTVRGLSAYLRPKNPDIKIVVAQPHPDSRLTDEHPDVSIIDGVLPVEDVPDEDLSPFTREIVWDEVYDIKTEEAFATARELVKTDGLLIGTSSAATLLTARRLAEKPENEGKNIVVIMPDNGLKYLSTPMFR